MPIIDLNVCSEIWAMRSNFTCVRLLVIALESFGTKYLIQFVTSSNFVLEYVPPELHVVRITAGSVKEPARTGYEVSRGPCSRKTLILLNNLDR